MSESDRVSGGDGYRQTLLLHLFTGPSKAFDTRRLVLDLVEFSELPQHIFCKVNSLFSLLLHYVYLAVGSGLAQG